MNKQIYLDHSATTPVDKRVLKKMMPYFSEDFGNPASVHFAGEKALLAVEEAREQVASFLNCSRSEVVFTSGATESDNLAIFGTVNALRKYLKENSEGSKNGKLHIITTQIEHPAVMEPFQALEKGGVEVTYLPVNSMGIVDVGEVKKAIKENTGFISIMYVNSEVGSKQPIEEIGKLVKQERSSRLEDGNKNPIYFHTDATQAVNFFDCDVQKLNVDSFSFSGHKIYGPKGVGGLFVRKGILIEGIQLGGHQESNLRSGTLNVTGIVGLGEAISLVQKNQKKDNEKIGELRDRLMEGILKNIPDVKFNTSIEHGTPAHAHFTFLGAEGEAILLHLSLEGIAVSTGSACASKSLKASGVLLAMGISEEVAHGGIRFTLGKDNTKEEIDRVVKVLPGIMEKLRKMAPEI